MDQIVKVDVNDDEIAPFMQDISRYFEYVEKEDLIKKIVSLEFGKFLAYYADAPEILPVSSKKERREERGERKEKRGDRRMEVGYRRLFINLGKADGFYPGELMQFLNKNVQGRVDVGHIDLLQKYAYFDVPDEDAKRVMQSLNGQRYKRREVRCNDASEGGRKEARGERREVRGERKEQGTRSKISPKKPEKRQTFKKNDWQAFMNPKTMKLKGEIPDFTEEGWARRKPRKK